MTSVRWCNACDIRFAGGVLGMTLLAFIWLLRWRETVFPNFFRSSTSESGSGFLVRLCWVGIMKYCSLRRCQWRWCQWALVVVQLAGCTGCRLSKAVRLCVPGTLRILPLCWPASSEVEAACLRANLRCSFILLSLIAYDSSGQKHPRLFCQILPLPFFLPLTTEVQRWLRHLQ